MTAEGSGAGRRLTVEEEQRGAEMFAAGASDTQVAEALSVGRATANRLRHRVGKQPVAAASEPQPDGQDEAAAAVAAEPDQTAAALTALLPERDRLADVVAGLAEREAVSRQAAADLDAERMAGLAATPVRSDPALRERIRNAEQDALDWAKAGELAHSKLQAVEQQIAAVLARQELARLRTELAAAVTARDAMYGRSGDRQRAAVEAVWAAAVDFAAVPADEQAADSAVAQALHSAAVLCQQLGEPVPAVPAAAPCGLPVPGDTPAGPPLALIRALNAARRGDVGAVAVQLGEAGGWLPPAPPTEDELAERRKLAEQRARVLQEERIKTMAGPGWQPPPAGANLDDYSGRRLDPYVARSLDVNYPAQRSGPRYSLDG